LTFSFLSSTFFPLIDFQTGNRMGEGIDEAKHRMQEAGKEAQHRADEAAK